MPLIPFAISWQNNPKFIPILFYNKSRYDSQALGCKEKSKKSVEDISKNKWELSIYFLWPFKIQWSFEISARKFSLIIQQSEVMRNTYNWVRIRIFKFLCKKYVVSLSVCHVIWWILKTKTTTKKNCFNVLSD